jgi:hypothetical protein
MRYPVSFDLVNGWALVHKASCETYINRNPDAKTMAWLEPQKTKTKAKRAAAMTSKKPYSCKRCQP